MISLTPSLMSRACVISTSSAAFNNYRLSRKCAFIVTMDLFEPPLLPYALFYNSTLFSSQGEKQRDRESGGRERGRKREGEKMGGERASSLEQFLTERSLLFLQHACWFGSTVATPQHYPTHTPPPPPLPSLLLTPPRSACLRGPSRAGPRRLATEGWSLAGRGRAIGRADWWMIY